MTVYSHQLRALVVQPPWSWAIRPGGKTVENRAAYAASWKYRGLVLIQAGMNWSARGAHDSRVLDLADQPGLARGPIKHALAAWDHRSAPDMFHPGAVVSVAIIADIHLDSGCCEPWGESEYTEGAGRRVTEVAHLVLEDVFVLPRPVDGGRGQLGLFTPPPEVAAAVLEQLVRADWPGLVTL